MIVNGWFDWAIKHPGKSDFTYAGTNQVKGIFLHSAEGYRDYLMEHSVNGPLSWHFTNMLNGDFYQHHPITARCWHATAANFDYLGMENEGVGDKSLNPVPEPTLSEPQIQNAVRAIKELELYKGKKASRFWPNDQFLSLCEHNEVVRIGGTGTACPSGRIPWQTIQTRLEVMPTDQDEINALLALAHFIRNGWNLNDLSDFDIAAIEQAVAKMKQAQV